jgi:hypothetical protein
VTLCVLSGKKIKAIEKPNKPPAKESLSGAESSRDFESKRRRALYVHAGDANPFQPQVRSDFQKVCLSSDTTMLGDNIGNFRFLRSEWVA